MHQFTFMQPSGRTNIRSIYLVAGILAGLLTLLIVYSIIFSGFRMVFTFQGFAELHQQIGSMYLLDLFPVLTAVAGLFLGHRHANIQMQSDKNRERWLEHNIQVAGLIRNMSAGHANEDTAFQGVDDKIITSLRSLQQKLDADGEATKEAREAGERQRWTSDGLAVFGDLLRTNTADEEKLGYAVISELVRYLGINQGGFFVARRTQSEQYLEMIACHAYDRKKFPGKKLAWGEGLIGAVAIERQTFYTDRIPENYLTITSGLGRATPRFLLIVPMFLSDEVFGVLELASFHEFPDHQVRFVEKVAENTASTLHQMFNTLRTAALLRETREQATKLAILEEQARKNIEELKAAQSGAARQSEQYISFTNTVNHTLIRAEYAPDGTVLYANTRFLRQLGFSGNLEVEGKHIELFIHAADRAWFRGMWEKLTEGGPHFEGYMRHVTKLGQELWTMATYTCLRKDDDSIDKIIFLAIDATSQKEENLRFECKIKALDRLLPQAECSTDGKILFANDQFREALFGIEGHEENLSMFELAPLPEQERFNEIWQQVVGGESFSGQIRLIRDNEEERWFLVNLSPIRDPQGEVHRIVFLGIDNSREKELERSLRDQNDQIREIELRLKIQSLDMENRVDEMAKQRSEDRKEAEKEAARFADILEVSPIPVISVNNQGFVVLFNRASEKYFKLRKNKVLNQPGDRLFGKDQPDPIIRSFYQPQKQVIETDHSEVVLTLPDRQMRKVHVSIFETKSGKERISTLFIYKH